PIRQAIVAQIPASTLREHHVCPGGMQRGVKTPRCILLLIFMVVTAAYASCLRRSVSPRVVHLPCVKTRCNGFVQPIAL
ncbi:MAG: hypothetical protein QOG58_756, partial [Caballeronia sp.]|nr:hypothetical protein [Caballeronia sp.]